MKSIRLGGVPEHFNFPWHYGIENGMFKQLGIELTWKDYPGGTGAMIAALQHGELDMALLLTEGAIKEIAAGAYFKLTKPYIASPLIWGIHTSAQNMKASIQDLSNQKYAISRLGSGSHLMAYIHAQAKGITLNKDHMTIVANLDGARKALFHGEADLFFWERFTTKPLVDNGEFKLLATFPTPWPCFVLVTQNAFEVENSMLIKEIGMAIDKITRSLQLNPEHPRLIADRYHLQENDVREWLKVTQWAKGFEFEKSNLTKVINALEKIDMMPTTIEINSYVHPSITLI